MLHPMKTPPSPLLLSLLLLAPLPLLAQTASDIASNSAYDANWSDGTNGGFGFGAWDLSDNNNDEDNEIFAGYFIGDSTDGAGDINTSGESFAIYANPGPAFATARRSFTNPLGVNDEFSVDLGINFDNGSKGFSLRGANTQIFNFNVGGGASINTDFTNNATTADYNYGGAAMIEAVLRVTSLNSLNYAIRRVSPEGIQGILFAGSITGITESIESLSFYVAGTDIGGAAQNNLYFNNLEVNVVPEPGAFALLAGLSALAWIALRRRAQ